MAWHEWTIQRLQRWRAADQQAAAALLAKEGLGWDDPSPDLLLIARDASGLPIGTAALSGQVLKQLVVADAWRGSGLFAELVTVLVSAAAARGIYQLFVFTKPQAGQLVSDLGFRLIAATSAVALLEYGHPGLESYLAALHQSYRPANRIAGLVMNCNPFTFGHQYLVTTAASSCDLVHLFVVSENRSLFPSHVRLRLVQAGVAHLPNVMVHEGGPYVISSATFPNYFLRQPGAATVGQAELDATIFARHIAPTLGITDRFLGQEPLDPTTASYNEAILRILPAAEIRVQIIERQALDGLPISASTVRQAIRDGDWSRLEQLVPASTLRYLHSPEAAEILAGIRANHTPH